MLNDIENNLDWNQSDLVVVIPIILASVFFMVYWFIAESSAIKNRFYSKYSFDEASYKHIIFKKMTGFIAMGIFPILICLLTFKTYSLADFGLTIIKETSLFSLFWILGLSAVIVPLGHVISKREQNFINYPQIRSKIWTKKMVFMNAFGWFLYLFGYELLFRGVLLFPVADAIGIWPAIVINIALYSVVHIPKGIDETIVSIPLGFLFCLLTFYSGTIWIAFFVHVAMAWTNTFTSLKYNPETNYIKS